MDLAGIGRRVVVATHRRSGTHLTIDLLRRQFPACRSRKRLGEGLDSLYLNLDRLGPHPRPLDEQQALELLRRAARPIVKTHDLPHVATGAGHHAAFVTELFADADVLCVFRDGRDVMASLHLYVRGYDPGAPASFAEFLREERDGVSRVRRWARDVRACLAMPGVIPLAFEDLLGDPRSALLELGTRLGMQPLYLEPLLPAPVRSRWGSRLRRLLTREPEATTVPAGPRPTRRRDWRDVFTREDRAFFQREAGDLLVELGYEISDAWVEGVAA